MKSSYAKGNFRNDLESLYLEYYQKHFGEDGIGEYDNPLNEEKVTSIQFESSKQALELLLLTFCTPNLDNVVSHLPANVAWLELLSKHNIDNYQVEPQEDAYNRADLLGASYVTEDLKLAYIYRQLDDELIAAEELDSLARSMENTLVIVEETGLEVSEKDAIEPLLLESPKLVLVKDGTISAHQSTIELLQLVKRMNLSLGQSFEQPEHYAYETIPVAYKKPDGIKVHTYKVKGTYEETPEALVVVINGKIPEGSDGSEHYRYIHKETLMGLTLYDPSAVIFDCREMEYSYGDSFLTIFDAVEINESRYYSEGDMRFPAFVCVSDKCKEGLWSLLTPNGKERPAEHIFENFDACVETAVIAARDWLDG